MSERLIELMEKQPPYANYRLTFCVLVCYNIYVDEMFGGVLSALTKYLVNTQAHAF